MFAFLSGCVSTNYNYLPSRVDLSEPPLGSVVTVHVGESMVRQGRYTEHDAIYLNHDTKVGGALASYTITRGYYLKQGEDGKSEFYLPGGGPDSGRVIKSALADPFKIIRLDKKTGKFCGVTVFNLEVCTRKADYIKKKYPITATDSFQQTLIYSGKVGSKINVGYREFSSNYARPAFNNDVEYDLLESTAVAYKGCRIEVIEATNEYIKYK